MSDTAAPPPTSWSRIRPLVPYLLTAALFAAGTFALYRLLEPVDVRAVAGQVRAMPWSVVALAALCTTGGYAALVGYDWSALRHIGRTLPLPVVVLGGFLGYAFGNTVGAGPVTGGVVRYRIYSALGLSAYDIAAVAIFSSLAFGLGATIIGFGALVWRPDALRAVISLDPVIARWGAAAIVVVSLGTLGFLALSKSAITVRGVRIAAPSPGIVAGQIAFTAADMLMAATTLYLLLPASDLGFSTFLAVFAAAMMAGVLSHVPGGVGVFETVIIAALPASVPVVQSAAALLLFRLIYYVAPFLIGLVILALSELRMTSGKVMGARLRVVAPVFGAVGAVAPIAMSAMIFGSGALMLVSSLIPPTGDFADQMEALLPLAFLEGGALLSSAIGAVLLLVAHGLLRRVEGAWWLAVAALLGGIVAALLHGFDIDRAVILAFALLILLPTRREFHRATRLTRNVFSLRWLLLIAGVAVMSLAVLFFAQKATPYAHELWWQFAADENAPRAMRAGLVGSLVLVLLLLFFALRPGRFRSPLATAEDLEVAAGIVAGQDDAEANIALTGDKSLLFSQSRKSFLMYRIRGRTWVALHEPVGRPAEASELVWAFHDAAYAANARPVFYSVSAESVPLWLDMGLALHKIGEEAIVRLDRFGLEGGARKRLRTAHSRALRDGLSYNLVEAPASDEVIAALKAISDEWLAEKKAAEKGFSIGFFDPAYLRRGPVATVSRDGRIVAFANLWRTGAGGRATIDLMRHVGDAPAGLMEFLFIELMLDLKRRGFAEFGLGNAPLAGLEPRSGRLSAQLGGYVYRHGGQFYNFEGLRRFKEKFDPDWRPVYVATPARANIVAVAVDIVALISGGRRLQPDPHPQTARRSGDMS